ncbi:MAG: hypothetical protein LBS71_03015, partial [Puniceicoccales bacterium]|nr:hypothetical protein [Puniceicoccales bacterium]
MDGKWKILLAGMCYGMVIQLFALPPADHGQGQKKVHGSIPSYKRIVRQIRILKKYITEIEEELQKKSLTKKRSYSIGAVLAPEDNLKEESHPLTSEEEGSVNVDVPMPESQKKVHGSIPSYKRIVRQIRILKKN